MEGRGIPKSKKRESTNTGRKGRKKKHVAYTSVTLPLEGRHILEEAGTYHPACHRKLQKKKKTVKKLVTKKGYLESKDKL